MRDARAKLEYGGNEEADHRVRIGALLAERGGPMEVEARDPQLRRG